MRLTIEQLEDYNENTRKEGIKSNAEGTAPAMQSDAGRLPLAEVPQTAPHSVEHTGRSKEQTALGKPTLKEISL